MKQFAITSAVFLIASLAATADVTVDFTVTDATLRNLNVVTLAFTVDGSGNVTLDAQSSNGGAGPQAVVNAWDGAVGTVSEASLFNTSFTLTGVAKVDDIQVIELSTDANLLPESDAIGVGTATYGRPNVINGAGGEELVWTYSGTGSMLNFKGVDYANRVANGDSNLTFLDGDTRTEYLLPNTSTSGSINLVGEGFSLASGESFIMTTDDLRDNLSARAASAGASVSGMTFEIIAGSAPPPEGTFDNDSGDNRWATPSNWDPDVLPAASTNATINGFSVIVDTNITANPAALLMSDATLTITTNGNLLVESMEAGTDLTTEERLVMQGSSALFGYSGSSSSDTITVGSALTIETRPDADGSSPLELGVAELSLETGCQWILDGAGYTGSYTVGDRFGLANFGSLSGNTRGVRFRNFDLPADRDLQLFNTTTSLYYEVVAQTAATGPNIIIVNVDDMVGGQHFNFEGRDCLSPTLDSFVANGLNYTEAFAASTVCGPSRYALMTGRWASRNTSANYISKYPLGTVGRFGVSDTEMEDDGENIGAWLQQAGYRTGFVGKAHLIDDDLLNTANWSAKGLITYGQSVDPSTNAAVNGAMGHNHRVVSQRMRPYGFDFVDGFYRANLLELRNDFLNVHNQEWITKNALDFIDENHNQRFFLYMAPTINHGPVRNDLSKSLLADPHYTSAGYLPNEDYSFMPARTSIVNEVTAAGKQLISARETWIDYSMAAISNKLAAHGLVNDTLIIFTADHGEKELNSSPVVWGKSSLYDLGMRVPLVMHWPSGITSPGRTYDESVGHIDFVPTLLELAGATNLPTRVLDGKSLVAVLNGSSASLRDDIFCEIGYARGVRSKDWKYIAVRYTPTIYGQIGSGYLWKNFDTGLFTEPRPYYVNNSSLGYLAQKGHPGYYDDDQLYDLSNDPMEQNNLYGQHPEIAYNLKKRLGDYMGDIPNRPFREFDDASTEFSPAPAGAPTAPSGLQMQFLGIDDIQLDWSDAANSELGYIVEQSTNGTSFGIVSELPSGSTQETVSVSSGVEDIVLRVSAYNALGDSAAATNVDLLAPDNWRYRTFGSTTSSNSQWTADADSDGLATVWEYAFATDPLDSNSTDRVNGEILSDGTNTWLQITVPRDSRRDVAIQGRVSTNLQDWAIGAPDVVVAEDGEPHLIFRSSTPVKDAKKQFLQAEITVP